MTEPVSDATGAGGPPWNVSFTISVDDVVGYLRIAQANLNLVGSAIAIGLIALGILVTAFANDTFTGAFLMIAGVAFYAFGNTDYFDRWRVRRVGRSILGTEASFTIDEAGIASVNATGSGRMPWGAITEFKENKQVLVFRRDRINAAWIPKRAFASAEELTAVKDFIDAHIGRPTAAEPEPSD